MADSTTTRRELLAAAGAAALAAGCGAGGRPAPGPRYDVLIYGATPAGIAAAAAAGFHGARVLLIEPTARIGGMMTSGLSHTDFRTFEGLNGAFHQFRKRILAHYTAEYGAGSQQVEDTFQGTQGEPEVNVAVFKGMLAEHASIEVLTEHRLAGVEADRAESPRRIRTVEFRGPAGAAAFGAAAFIDATYEGDLMAAAGVEYRVGREGRGEFGESLAPPEPDGQLQGYNFRFIATREPGNRVAPEQPAGYRREDYLDLLPLLADGTIESVFGYPSKCIFKAQIPRLPNAKYDINDVSNAPVRLSLPGENLGWPEGGEAERARIFAEHLRWNAGLLWFLQNDDVVPRRFRDEAREWGWCKDELVETDHLPPQLYVREARRMRGLYVYTEQDTRDAEGDARAILQANAIAMGDYGPNCHGTAHEGPRIGGRHTGEFYKRIAPYQIPYGVLAPRDVANLLVPGAASSSHVGFCALRLEPIWMSLGQAAGHAAAFAAEGGASVQEAPVRRLQQTLWAEGAATIYVSDVGPDHPDFAAVQWWGSAGGLHGLAAPQPERRGKNILGQYFEAFPGHAVELDRQVSPELYERWRELAVELGTPAEALPAPGGGLTRGDWIRKLWSERSDTQA